MPQSLQDHLAPVLDRFGYIRHRRHAVRLGTVSLPSKGAARELIQSVLHGMPVNTPLPDEYTPVLLAILAWHPRADEKLAHGCRGFLIQRNPPLFKEKDRGFYIITERPPPARVSFSYLRCFKGSDPPENEQHNRLTEAARAAIIPSQLAFKDRHFVPGAPCPACGVPLTLENAHVDHVNPKFRAIVAAFVDRYGMPPAAALRHRPTYGWQFVEQSDALVFATYHDALAVRELVCASCNMRAQ